MRRRPIAETVLAIRILADSRMRAGQLSKAVAVVDRIQLMFSPVIVLGYSATTVVASGVAGVALLVVGFSLTRRAGRRASPFYRSSAHPGITHDLALLRDRREARTDRNVVPINPQPKETDSASPSDLRIQLAFQMCQAGVIRFEKGQTREAISKYIASIELDDSKADVFARLGAALSKQGDLEGASLALERAMALDARASGYPCSLATAYLELGRFDDAMKAARTAIGLNPRSASSRLNLALAYEEAGDWAGATTELLIAIEIDPNIPEAYGALGCVYRRQEKTEAAIAAFRKAVELDSKFATAHNNLGNALCDVGRVDEAIVCYRRLLATEPNHAAAHANLGNALTIQGMSDAGIEHYEKAIAMDPNLALAHYNLACIHASQRQEAEAVASLRKAVKLDESILKLVDADMDFDPLRQRPVFQAALASCRV